MRWLHTSLVGAEQPALDQRSHEVDAGKQLVSLRPRAGDDEGLVHVVVCACRRVGRPSVTDDGRAWLDVVEQELAEHEGARVLDDLETAAPEAPPGPLDGHLDQGLSERTPTGAARLWSAENGLVDLDAARESVPAGADHGRPIAVQHRPSGLLGADAELALQPERRDPVLLARHVPRGREPHAERRSRPVEDRAGSHRHPARAR